MNICHVLFCIHIVYYSDYNTKQAKDHYAEETMIQVSIIKVPSVKLSSQDCQQSLLLLILPAKN